MAKNGKPDPLEWAVPTEGDSDWEIKAWAIWEYSRELYSRDPFSALCAAGFDRQKGDAIFKISYAVFGTSAPLILNGRLETPWKALQPGERKRMIGLLIVGAEAFTARLEMEAPCTFENGQLQHNYQTPFVNLPRGIDVIRGRFAFDRAKGKERIVKEFEQWLEKACKVKRRKRGRVDGPREWIHALANLRYLAAHGESIPVKPDGSRNLVIKDPSAPSKTRSHLMRSAAKAEGIVAECVAIAEQVSRQIA